MGTLSADERDRALELLDRSDQTRPLVAPLRESFLSAGPAPVEFARVEWARSAGSQRYAAIVSNRWFRRVIAAIFILAGLVFVLSTTATAAVITGALLGFDEARAALDEEAGGSTVASVIQAIAGLAAGALIVRGVFALRRSRIRAYRAFELAILIDLLLAQPFAFLDTGFGAAVDVFIDLALLATLRYMQAQERRLLVGAAA